MKKFFTAVGIFLAMMLLLAGCTQPAAAEPKATLDRTEVKLTVGGETTLTAQTENCEGFTWTTSDETVATLTWGEGAATATVKGVAAGTATVRIMYQDKVLAECTVTVSVSPLTVFLPEGKLVLVKNGVATVKALCEVPVEGEAVWKVADETVGSVEWQGLTARVKALKRGTTTVTVTLGEYQASFELLVGTVG